MGNLLSSRSSSVPDDPIERLRYYARDEIAKRNKCFEDSKQAYHRKDHARAKKLSKQGKDHDAKAKKLNAEAADMVFKAKNAGRPSDEIDLHGLKVQEALAKVEQVVRQCKADGRKRVTFIVGRGLHSGPDGPKIKPAVMSLINKHSLRCTLVNEGSLLVELVPREQAGWFEGLVRGCAIC
uniref:Smr domain-containing protein n=1 Tax=Chlamydomonas leiostraca TaxID=1034604 RepID=A0A7S0S0K1_9CHLO|mmetsp:Transcript_37027/g.93374  ORF Transcript_37027/g.93374 Transcript_37027/m.93374 type:complete len:181 (+) Transcript_37027:80-622(+)